MVYTVLLKPASAQPLLRSALFQNTAVNDSDVDIRARALLRALHIYT
jgi:hypothetical protein